MTVLRDKAWVSYLTGHKVDDFTPGMLERV